MSERNFMLEAKALTEKGSHSEAVYVLRMGVEQSDNLQDRMFCAGTIVSSIIHYNHNGELPAPGTLDYEECRKYAQIALDCFGLADVVTQSGFHDLADEMRTILTRLERDTSQAGAYQADSNSALALLSEVREKTQHYLGDTLIIPFASDRTYDSARGLF
jgi:hypothetical protein